MIVSALLSSQHRPHLTLLSRWWLSSVHMCLLENIKAREHIPAFNSLGSEVLLEAPGKFLLQSPGPELSHITFAEPASVGHILIC